MVVVALGEPGTPLICWAPAETETSNDTLSAANIV